MNARRLPIVVLEINGEKRKYYADERLREYRSVDGSEPWIVKPSEVNAEDMSVIIREFEVSN